MSAPIIIDAATVRRHLDPQACLAAVRAAMSAVSSGRSRQLLRSVIDLGDDRMFGTMPGALAVDGMFGAKLVSVFPDPDRPGRRAHRGVVALFDPADGAPLAFVDAEEITIRRTAAASALATDLLARADAGDLAIFGTGAQAIAHAVAIAATRPLRSIRLWGRSPKTAISLAAEIEACVALPVTVEPDVERAARMSDVLCTVTGSASPILFGRWVSPGAHINAVGSSHADAAEIDTSLVVAARVFADSRASVLAQGGEFLAAMRAGVVTADHIVAEIGDVANGVDRGRRSDDEITLYKSLGHACQDIAAAALVYQRVTAA